MIPYFPEFTSSRVNRPDQAIWDLVGMQPVTMALDNAMHQVDAWVTTSKDEELFQDLRNILSRFQEITYDKFSVKSPSPSEQVKRDTGYQNYP